MNKYILVCAEYYAILIKVYPTIITKYKEFDHDDLIYIYS